MAKERICGNCVLWKPQPGTTLPREDFLKRAVQIYVNLLATPGPGFIRAIEQQVGRRLTVTVGTMGCLGGTLSEFDFAPCATGQFTPKE